MEYPIGTEMTEKYLSYEAAMSAMKLVKDVMLVKKGETVVITADTSTDRRVVESVAQATYAIGAEPTVIYYPTTYKAFEEPVLPIAEAVAVADVWIEFAYYCIMHTPCFQKSLENGTRYTCLTGMDITMMVNTIGKIDYDLVVAFGEYLTQYIQNGDEVIVKDKNGTHLTAYNRGRRVKHSGQLATKKGYPIMLGGQVSWCPIEETINGTLVFDVAAFPPADLGILQSNITMEFENGVVKIIKGGREAEIFEQWLSSFNDPNMYRLAHYSIGFNPGVVKPTGRIVEDERIFGCIEFGLGSQGASLMGSFWNAASHTDGVVSKPTIIVDGKYLEENGIYVDAQAIDFCKKLKIKGY
jgi:leucyl aminopeptidase (aminopeptidase T)